MEELFQKCDQHFANHLPGDGGRNAARVVPGRELAYVAADDAAPPADGLRRTPQRVKRHAAGLRRPRAGEHRRVQHIKVEREIDRPAGKRRERFRKPSKSNFRIAVCPSALHKKLAPVARTDAELKDASVAQDIVAAAEHRRVGKPVAQVFVPQVGVRVKVDDGQVG